MGGGDVSHFDVEDRPQTNSAPDFGNPAEAEPRHQNYAGAGEGFDHRRTPLSYSQRGISPLVVVFRNLQTSSC